MTRIRVSLDVFALRALRGDAFDFDAYEKGRADARESISKGHAIDELAQDATRWIKAGDYEHTPGPDYWIGCLAELELH